MDKNEIEVSGDWDLVSSACDEESENNGETGSSKETEGNKMLEGSKVEDIGDLEKVDGNDSSSDIDIIDETMEEIDIPSESCFIPSSLPISPSVEKVGESSPEESVPTSSGEFTTAPSETEKNENIQAENAAGGSCGDSSFLSWTVGGRRINDWLGLIWEYIQNLTGFQLSCLFGLTFCIYFCITINQTNIIALQEKGNVVGQMEKLVDELRSDNKHLQEKMLSEMKNDKLVSSFEHQIRELKKENSKLNHMLHDVVKVLEKQKETQEKLLVKKESEYQAPFKKEIDKLREHINILKFDNEELQKQLVRMRYSSYSQGSKHANMKDRKEYEKHKSDKSSSRDAKLEDLGTEYKEKDDIKSDGKIDELPLDLLQLKKWNELLDQFAKEYGLFEVGDTTTEKENGWNWREELKRKFKKPTDYVSDVASFYSNFYKKMFSDVYKSASSYLSDTQKNVQSLFETVKAQNKNPEESKMWNVINDLGKKWVEVKEKVLSTYNFDKSCPTGKNAEKDDRADMNTADSSVRDAEENREQVQSPTQSKKPRDTGDKWYFKRAQLREKLREEDVEETQNWFLRKKTGLSSEKFDDVDGLTVENEKQEF